MSKRRIFKFTKAKCINMSENCSQHKTAISLKFQFAIKYLALKKKKQILRSKHKIVYVKNNIGLKG